MSIKSVSSKATYLLEKPLEFYHQEIKKTFHKLPEKGIAAELAKRVILIIVAPFVYAGLALLALVGKGIVFCARKITDEKFDNTQPLSEASGPHEILRKRLQQVVKPLEIEGATCIWPQILLFGAIEIQDTPHHFKPRLFNSSSVGVVQQTILSHMLDVPKFMKCKDFTLQIKLLYLDEGRFRLIDAEKPKTYTFGSEAEVNQFLCDQIRNAEPLPSVKKGYICA